MLGEIVGGSASLLICMFLGPRFIEYLRLKEFGQHIREEGLRRRTPARPALHDGRSRGPSCGLRAVPDPVRVQSREPGCARHRPRHGRALWFADDITKLRKRRRSASPVARSLVQALTAIALWLVVTEYVEFEDTLNLRIVDASIDLGLAYPILIFPVLAGRHQRGQPDRRPRRARGRLLRNRLSPIRR